MKTVPFSKKDIEALAAIHPTPFYVYDEAAIRATTERLLFAFAWNKGFKEYFAVKALPNPRILSIMREEKCGADCSSLAELMLSEKVGLSGADIMFTSNDTPLEEYKKAIELGALINLDALEHIDYIANAMPLPDFISFRYNPGPLREGNAIIGKPEEAKFGVTEEQLYEGYKRAKSKGVKRFGLHTMVASNERNTEYFIETARMLFAMVANIREKAGVEIELVNLGGGLGIPYRTEDSAVELEKIGEGIRKLYEEQKCTFTLAMECGRFITGPHGYLVSRVRHLKETYRKYAGLDATMANLMRPGMYGAYHHITVLGKEESSTHVTYDVVGSLCENNDKFAITRKLPMLSIGDIVVMHDAGAHGHAMGFNYNGKLRCAEFLLKANHSFEMIRRAETLDDYFATLNF